MLPGERTDKGLVRTQIDAGQGLVGGRRQRGELLQGGDAIGPGRVGQSEQGLGLSHRADPDLGHLLGRSGQVLDRAELPADHREHVDRPQEGR